MRFAVTGDWGAATPAQAAVTRRMCAESDRGRFAFVLTTGDNFSAPDGVATHESYWGPGACIIRRGIPWRPAWGNDDVRGEDTARVLGAPGRYYSFGAGPARVVVLDANRPADPAQEAFLGRALREAREPVRIVAFHQPAYTAGVHAPGREQQRRWAPLFRRHRVALVLQGHNHLYERLEVDGVTYVTTGGGGAQLFPCVRPAAGLRACRLAHHFLAVTVTRRAVGLRAITARGATIERVRIPVARGD